MTNLEKYSALCQEARDLVQQSIQDCGVRYECPITYILEDGGEIDCGVTVMSHEREQSLWDRLRNKAIIETHINFPNRAACTRLYELNAIDSTDT